MSQHTHQIFIPTQGKGLYPFTRPVTAWIRSTGVSAGILTVFIQHTSESLVIQENADPDVVLDLRDFFERLAPEGDPRYRHTAEGDDVPTMFWPCKAPAGNAARTEIHGINFFTGGPPETLA